MEMKMASTKEQQFNDLIKNYEKLGPVKLGIHTTHFWRTNPKRLLFMLSRYKFIAKMLSGCKDAMEIGCGDGFGAGLVLQEVGKVHCVDFDPLFIEHCLKERKCKGLTFEVADLTKHPIMPRRDAIYSVDVLEHVKKKNEGKFLKNIIRSLKSDGICIMGTPTLESQKYASIWSKEGHVNCKTGEELKKTMLKYFERVFVFSMNDEVVHTGFYPMAHYLFAIGVYPKNKIKQ
jgi:2-polyprenyl-3-methyl-5-hydroxy-6-metoxy-1,4-benzoquinol methylase